MPSVVHYSNQFNITSLYHGNLWRRTFYEQYKGKENIKYYKDIGVRKPLSRLG